MTSFNTGNLPPTITTVERLLCWSSTVLQDLYPDMTVIEYPGQLDRVIQCTPLFVTAESPAHWRYIGRYSVPMANGWQRSNKLWTQALEFGSAPIPAEYQS